MTKEGLITQRSFFFFFFFLHRDLIEITEKPDMGLN